MSKFSLLNLLLLMAVIALTVSLVFENRNRTVTISDDGIDWTIPEYLATRSTWVAHLGPPPLTMLEAMASAKSFGDYLNSEVEDTGCSDWKLASISISNIPDPKHQDFWVYIATIRGVDEFREYQDIKIVILMDGAIAFDPTAYSITLAAIVRDYPGILYAPNDHRYPLEDSE